MQPPEPAAPAGMDPRLAALVVHDLKNALGGLEGHLAEWAGRSSEPAASLALAECSALRRRFVQFLTLYGAANGLPVHAADESPLDLLQALADEARRQRPAWEIDVLAPEAAPAFAFYDARLVRMAMDAALHNALRFGRGWIGLQALQRDGLLVLRIDDNGPGLAGAQTAPVPPEQAHATGLGTALCEAVARAHRHRGRQGHVTLAERPGGMGARFELCLA